MCVWAGEGGRGEQGEWGDCVGPLCFPAMVVEEGVAF